MSKQVLFKTQILTTIISIFAMIFFLISGDRLATILGFVIGNLVCAACLYLMWLTVQKRSLAWVFYISRVVLMFGSVLVCTAIPFINSLGVILPLIFSLPILAITSFSDKKGE